jgi:RNA polymerase sigma-70 factor (ECF subfamily)
VHALKLDWNDDATAIAGALAGDQDAFQALVQRYQDRIFRMLARWASDRMETEDLAQEVFVKVFRKLHTFQHGSSFYTWLYRIAVNTASDWHARRRTRRLHLVEDVAEVAAAGRRELQGSSAAEPLLAEELARVTREVLATLPEKYKTVLILREYEDMSYNEMAEVIGCSIGTVESRLFRARQRFKQALERRYPDLVPQTRGGER